MIAKGVPREFGYESMVLVRISSPVCEDEVGIHLLFQLLEEILHSSAAIRKKTVAVVLQDDGVLTACREKIRRFGRFLCTDPAGAEDHPMKRHLREPGFQLQ